jgi:hypothetical protein
MTLHEAPWIPICLGDDLLDAGFDGNVLGEPLLSREHFPHPAFKGIGTGGTS